MTEMKRGDVVLYHYTANRRNEKMLAVVMEANLDTVEHRGGKVQHVHLIRFLWGNVNATESEQFPYEQQLADHFLTVLGNLGDLGIDIDGLPAVL